MGAVICNIQLQLHKKIDDSYQFASVLLECLKVIQKYLEDVGNPSFYSPVITVITR